MTDGHNAFSWNTTMNSTESHIQRELANSVSMLSSNPDWQMGVSADDGGSYSYGYSYSYSDGSHYHYSYSHDHVQTPWEGGYIIDCSNSFNWNTTMNST